MESDLDASLQTDSDHEIAKALSESEAEVAESMSLDADIAALGSINILQEK